VPGAETLAVSAMCRRSRPGLRIYVYWTHSNRFSHLSDDGRRGHVIDAVLRTRIRMRFYDGFAFWTPGTGASHTLFGEWSVPDYAPQRNDLAGISVTIASGAAR